jgi:hypothetical protein
MGVCASSGMAAAPQQKSSRYEAGKDQPKLGAQSEESSRYEAVKDQPKLGAQMEEAMLKMRDRLKTVEIQRPMPVLPSAATVFLHIHTLAGKRQHTLEAHVNYTIWDVKRMICKEASQILGAVLVSESEVLEDDTKVSDLPLQKNDAGQQSGILTLVNVQLDPKKLEYVHKSWETQGLVSSWHIVSYNGTEIWKRANGYQFMVDTPSEISVCIDQDSAKLRVTFFPGGSSSPTTELLSVQELVRRADAL